ncbi:MAG: hypothetical protein JWM33_1992 [Caulobacteraceae bacterium]|nr:hypothetical protein [Caulobacteraceae bacterium]
MISRGKFGAGLRVTLAALVLLAGGPGQAAVSAPSAAQLREETYEAAQGVVASTAADAMTQVSAQFGAGQGELADLVRQRQDLLAQQAALQQAIDTASANAGEGLAAIAARAQLSTLRDQASALALKVDGVEQTIVARYPAYAELTRPRPLSAQQTEGLLEDDEAILLIVPGDDATYLWALTPTGFDWARSPLTEAEITTAVKSMRANLDAAGPGGFDRASAFKLYSQLVAPLEPLFKSKHVLFVAAAGALQSLPLSLLVTAAPQGSDADPATLAKTPWLVDRYATVTLPAISSLYSLRCLGAGAPHAGCPKTPGAAAAKAAPATAPAIAYAGLGGPTLGGAGNDSRGAEGWEQYAKGDLADPDKLRGLQPLPGATSEIAALADLFQAKGAFVRTGDQFTETLVKTSPQIRSAGILHFATHALMSGESDTRGQPGLVLTPPDEAAASALDDGLLTASEAAALNIQASFVVLSACNTARADGTLGADGLSGLARSFFYAGAKSLLVSHWSVDDSATKALMVDLFTTLGGGKVSRAIALQQAIKAVKGTKGFENPRFWAPFVLVGESGGA